jgi:hypothetical protein
MLGSLSIAVNALAGPAILQLPFTYQQAGVIPTTVALCVVAMLSALCCTHTANIVSKVPGNANYDQSVEFSDPFQTFWSSKAYTATQVIFFACTLCVNLAAIVDTAEIVDSFLGHWKGTWGYAFDAGEFQEWHHTTHPCSRQKVKLGKCMPFASDNYGQSLLTLGYLITAAVFLPICLMDLKVRTYVPYFTYGRLYLYSSRMIKAFPLYGWCRQAFSVSHGVCILQENARWQIFGFFVLITISAQFIICFLLDGLKWDNVTMWGETWDSMLGVILFNFGLVMAIPAWLGEKKPHISVGKVVYGSTAISLVLYVAVGLLGALAIPHVNSNMLEPMVSGAFGLPLRMGASFFAFFIIGLDIPLFSVLTRYNLVNSGMCSTRTANILVVYLPWGFGWLFYQGSAISELLSWGGILFTGAIAFLLPLCLAVRVLRQTETPGSIKVYGNLFSSRKAEVNATIALFVFAAACVTIAIIGQAVYDDER